jgi:hypothetical protein
MATIEQLTAELSAKDEKIALLEEQLAGMTKLVSGLRSDLQSANNAAKQTRKNPLLRLCESSDEEPVAPKPAAGRRARKRYMPTSPGRTIPDDLGPAPWKFSDDEKPLDTEPKSGEPTPRRRKIEWILVDG